MILSSICFFTLSTSNTVDAKISLYDSSNNELTSLSNVDFPFSSHSNPNLNYYESDTIIEGKLEIARFERQNASGVSGEEVNDVGSSPCTLKPISVGIALLVIPFDEAQELGCASIDDLISRNNWMTQDMTPPVNNQTGLPNGTTILPNGTYSIPVNVKKRMTLSSSRPTTRDSIQLRGCGDRCSKFTRKSFKSWNRETIQLTKRDDPVPSSGIPQVIVFTSTNGGDPGIKEPVDSRGDIQKVRVGLTLLRKDDMDQLMNLANITNKVSVTSDVGPWIRLLKSRSWIAWSVTLGVVYGLIFIFSCSAMCYSPGSWRLPENSTGFISNPNLFMLPGIAFCSMTSLIILHVDPGNIREEWFSATNYSIITGVVFLLLCIFYVGLQYSWIKASIEITKCDVNLSPIVRLVGEFQRFILLFGFCVTVVVFFFSFMTETTQNNYFSTIFSIVNKSLFITLMNLGYLLFGIFMIYDLATNREINQKIGETLMFKFSSKADKGRALQVLTILVILMISFSFLTISNVAVSDLNPTINNFWKTRVTDDLSKSISMISMLFLLRSHQLSRFLVNPVSSLLTNRPLNRSMHPTPEQIEEDERRNSAAYTTRMAVVKPEPTYRMNPSRLSMGHYNSNSIGGFRGSGGGFRGSGHFGGMREKGGMRGSMMGDLGVGSGRLGGGILGLSDGGEKGGGDGTSGGSGVIPENPSSPKDYIKLSGSKFTNGGKSETSKFDIIDL